MPFRFPLASVLLVRQNTEEREERALQKIQFEMARVIHQVEVLTAEIVKAHDAREQAMRQPIPAIQLHSFLWQAEACAEKKKTLLHRLQILEQERARQMKVYQAAHRDLETIVEMFNEQREAHDREHDRNEQKHLDDIFVARRQRN